MKENGAIARVCSSKGRGRRFHSTRVAERRARGVVNGRYCRKFPGREAITPRGAGEEK